MDRTTSLLVRVACVVIIVGGAFYGVSQFAQSRRDAALRQQQEFDDLLDRVEANTRELRRQTNR